MSNRLWTIFALEHRTSISLSAIVFLQIVLIIVGWILATMSVSHVIHTVYWCNLNMICLLIIDLNWFSALELNTWIFNLILTGRFVVGVATANISPSLQFVRTGWEHLEYLELIYCSPRLLPRDLTSSLSIQTKNFIKLQIWRNYTELYVLARTGLDWFVVIS